MQFYYLIFIKYKLIKVLENIYFLSYIIKVGKIDHEIALGVPVISYNCSIFISTSLICNLIKIL